MVEHHPGAGITHHCSYALFHVGPITMYGATLASRLIFGKFTAFQPSVCISQQLLTISTERVLRTVVLMPAKNAYHIGYRLLFGFDTRLGFHSNYFADAFLPRLTNQATATSTQNATVMATISAT